MSRAPTEAAAPAPQRWLQRHLRTLLAGLGATMLVSSAAILWINQVGCTAGSNCRTLESLAQAADAPAFEAAVWRGATRVEDSVVRAIAPAAVATPASAAVLPEAAKRSILPLRTMMLLDSILLVPSYVGLLLIDLVVLHAVVLPRKAGPATGWAPDAREWWLHIACLLAVAAGVFDIAENGMTARAADDALERLLADPTVADVHLATLLKWLFIGLASAVVGLLAFLAWWQGRDGALDTRRAGPWLLAGALCAVAVAALLLAPGLWPAGASATIGGLLFALELLLVGVGLWRGSISRSSGLAAG